MSVIRWTLFDPNTGETYTFPINPSEGGDLGVKKNLGYQNTVAPDGDPVVYQSQPSPGDTSVKGVFLTIEDRDALKTWANKDTQLRLTNDLGEEMWIFIQTLEITRKRVASRRYKADYTMRYSALSVA